eukprot:gnl/Chilomastix_cuspidata/2613.p1 GENE.gnl/Chilomastix_cuspidata/2613~~gnl/Chilomastix_cuspidata/2613.p1  ORF type:complete len:815 (-),score=407.41 gnl/Chilomastix_cuspidata/2613:7-2451(-)
MGEPVYLDYNATTPLHPEVAREIALVVGQGGISGTFGNPSSQHAFGFQARQKVENSRQLLAKLLSCEASEIFFTSCGTESNNISILGAVELWTREHTAPPTIVISSVEHPATNEACAFAAKRFGARVVEVPVDGRCRLSADAAVALIDANTCVVSLMLANNEVGTVFPVAEVFARLRARRTGVFPLLHTDAAQAVGKVPVSVRALGCDLLSVAGHKLYAPKGVGALFCARGLRVPNVVIHGAEQERGARPGTENVIHIAALGAAAAVVARELPDGIVAAAGLVRALYAAIRAGLAEGGASPDAVRVNGAMEQHLSSGTLEEAAARLADDVRASAEATRSLDALQCLPNTLSVSFPGVEAALILGTLKEKVAASVGAACHSDRVDLSPVLRAMGVSEHHGKGTIRLSVGLGLAHESVEAAGRAIGLAAAPFFRDAAAAPEAPGGTAVCLTDYTTGLGCGCKLQPLLLEQILHAVEAPAALPLDARMLVGNETSDDAVVFRMAGGHAVVSTVDFFTPILDDPYQFGAASAANALSDIYAMGATPLFALAVCAFPSARLPRDVFVRVMQGATDKCAEAGVRIGGGHTVEDNELKFGLCCFGEAPEADIRTNVGVAEGDFLVLTKPVGSGVLSTGIKHGLAAAADVRVLTAVLTRLNKYALEAVQREPALFASVAAITDVTGFGLCGHLVEMIGDEALGAELFWDCIPLLGGAERLVLDFGASCVPGGTKTNEQWLRARHACPEALDALPAHANTFLLDPQTSGGLLLAVRGLDNARRAVELIAPTDPQTAIIGRIVSAEGAPSRVMVRARRPPAGFK